MTAVDHAELKRVAEGATPGKWIASVSGLPEWRNVEYFVESDHPGVNEGDTLVCTTNAPDSRDAAFIAAANPAVVLELLSEIEGLKAERDGERFNYDGALSDIDSLLRVLIRRINGEADLASAAEWVRLNYPLAAEAIRTQAPDSWRPDREAVARVLKAWCEGGLLQDYASVADAILALRPQTAESGK